MKIAKYLLPILMATEIITMHAYAVDVQQRTRFDRTIQERDDQPVREFVQSKENIELKDKLTELELSGDVRFEWYNQHEKGIILTVEEDGYNRFSEQYRHLRGGDAVSFFREPISTNEFDVVFNLKVKYTRDRSWASAHLEFDNTAGIRGFNECSSPYSVFKRRDASSYFCSSDELYSLRSSESPFLVLLSDNGRSPKGSGSANAISLKRAFIGYNVWSDGTTRLDVELGRRKLGDIFNSEVQFSDRFDGILLKYTTAYKNFADFYIYGGPFIIDYRTNHFGYAIETGLVDILDSGLDLSYSFIDWTKDGKNRCFVRNPIGWEFRNSQVTFDFHFNPEFRCKSIPAEFYGGFLFNHAAKKNIFTCNKRKNLAWYLGLYLGEVDSQGDWSIDIEYLYIQAQAVPDNDVGSDGRGNILDEQLTDIVLDTNQISFDINSDGSASAESIDELISSISRNYSSYVSSPRACHPFIDGLYFPRRGNANFKGWKVEAIYALTDNLSFDVMYQFYHEEDKKIGGKHRYSEAQVQAIYAF